MYFLYSVLTAAGMLLLTPYFLLKGLRQNKYLGSLSERLGVRLPAGLGAAGGRAPGTIWLHAVSVGEVLAALPLASSLKERFSERRLVVSTTTATGQALARQRASFADAVFYFPLDWPWPVRRALAAVRPALVIVMETEIWPNFLHEARRAGVPVVFVNSRVSERSFRRFSRAVQATGGLLRGFLRRVLSDATLYLAQSKGDAARLEALGAPRESVIVTGNMKYDLAEPGPNALGGWLGAELERSRRGPLLVAGSVLAGEEAAALEALDAVERRWPDALLLLAPRKPERFPAAAALVEQAGRRVVRRSALSLDGASSGALARAPGGPQSVLLLDTIGELAAIYALADAVFIGGSLEPAGGHNPLEAAVFGKVPVFGPSMQNFQEIAARFLSAGAAIEVRSGTELGAAWAGLLEDSVRSERMGRAARGIVEQNRGATAAALERLSALLAASQEHG
jgi:3-deoxy-D-manno-octulosonic-acid transferase